MRKIIRSAPQPPPLFGVRTDMLVVLAASGPVRRVGLMRVFGGDRTWQLPKSDPKGLCMQWRAQYGRGRGRSGDITAINWNFALAHEVATVLKVLAQDFRFEVEAEFKYDFAAVPSSTEPVDIDHICGSRNRTRILAALESLGGGTPLSILEQSVPEVRPDNVRVTAVTLIQNGILEKNDAVISFVKAPWTTPYRKLLRRYLQMRPDMAATVKCRAADKFEARKERTVCTLFGKAATERALLSLAERGPLTTAQLEQAASFRKGLDGVETLVRDGIIAKRASGVNPKGNPTHTYSLNTAHPIYRELRTLLRSIAAVPIRAKSGDFGTKMQWNKDHRLFGSVLPLRALIALAVSKHGEIEAQSISRIFPGHQPQSIAQQMGDFWEMGIVVYRPWKTLRLYRLDKDYPYYKELKALLKAIADAWPRYRESVRLHEKLHPPGRLAMEAGR